MTESEILSYPIPSDLALEPPAEWAELRAKCPVAHVRFASGDPASLVTRYDDVRAVLSDPRFSRGTGKKDAARVADTDDGGLFNSEMATVLPQEGEGHLTWRRLVGKWFTAKRMAALRPGITAMADQLIDSMIEKGGPVDLKAAFGFPLPVWVICDMLGVPDSDRDKFSYWSDCMLSMTRYTQDEMVAAMTEFGTYMAHHVELKRANRGDDLLSELIDATDADGRPLSTAVLVATGQGLLVAGHETTANMITKMVAMLLADRSRWEQVLADPKLVRSTVEEALRFDANAGFGMVRYIDTEIELSGVAVPSGTTVVCSMAAANRDESTFAGADELDLTRSPNPHLAFGAGAHSCLGQALARTELQVALETLLRRLPTLDLAVGAEELVRVDGLAVGGLSELPVQW
ncbi:cytochrome P450 [Promicromonospora sp. AC04]|uniref:cytochrome P450 n=1 Tax=Promicromonospora sp. AC04 TaxID=2135723 RepID=UPI000D3BF917|nr:cytochrome P450 [Promicromonospora sp. AC04]PUB25980.1 cytochrome P450 [Promicromonospora sp. AC04]